jgi:hypothetical protein
VLPLVPATGGVWFSKLLTPVQVHTTQRATMRVSKSSGLNPVIESGGMGGYGSLELRGVASLFLRADINFVIP